MNKDKLFRITAILTVILFIFTPVSAMSIKQVTNKKLTPNIISQSDFVIDLTDNEKIVWQADYVTRDDDIAYITMGTDIEIGETSLGLQVIPGQPPQPLLYWETIQHTIALRNWWGRILIYLKAKALTSYSFLLEKYTSIKDRSNGAIITFSERYSWIGDLDSDAWLFNDDTRAYVEADAYVQDWWLRRVGHFHAEVNDFPSSGSGYIEWEY